MLTLLNRIQQKLPQASESVLEQVWEILTATDDRAELSELASEFDRWEAASDEDEVQIENMLTTQQGM